VAINFNEKNGIQISAQDLFFVKEEKFLFFGLAFFYRPTFLLFYFLSAVENKLDLKWFQLGWPQRSG